MLNADFSVSLKWIALLSILFIRCGEKKKEGLQLAEKYCQTCHLLPKPGDLDFSTWKYTVLPAMAERLGINTGRTEHINTLKKFDLFPEEPLVTVEDWEKIIQYYISSSPLILPSQEYESESNLSKHPFKVRESSLRYIPPFTSMVTIDTSESVVLLGNSNFRTLFKLSATGSYIDSIHLDGIPSSVKRNENTLYVLLMDNLMPHDEANGKLVRISSKTGEKWQEFQTIITGLRRPVNLEMGDLNRDGIDDFVISSFGNTVGNLSVYLQLTDETYKQIILDNFPGNIQTRIYDFDSDGLEDILSLSAQGDEKIILYKNMGNDLFSSRVLLRFPPSYGSTHFELDDYNGDGIKDILYTNGDNGDYKPIYKSYHGIRLFKGKKDGSFEEDLFIPMNGAYKAFAKDFDLDGDLDIAAISYFPDYSKSPEEGFCYFENRNGKYTRHNLAEGKNGKWLVMDSADLDKDGDLDLILGSAMFMSSESPKKIKDLWFQQNSPILILHNLTNDK